MTNDNAKNDGAARLMLDFPSVDEMMKWFDVAQYYGYLGAEPHREYPECMVPRRDIGVRRSDETDSGRVPPYRRYVVASRPDGGLLIKVDENELLRVIEDRVLGLSPHWAE